jgi:cation diffusion facilitator family transporter
MEDRFDLGKRAGIVGIGANVLLFGVKLAASIISGSLSIITDAVNNLTDALSSVLVLVGYHIASKPADKEHPYGHARMEYISSLLIAVIVTFLGFEFFRESAGSLLGGRSNAKFSVVALVILLSSVLVKAALAVYYKIVAKKIDSAVLEASAADSIGDILSTSAVIVGMLLTPVLGAWCDSALGIVISLYILAMGVKLIWESADSLIGKAPDKEFVSEISQKVLSYKGVLGIHDLVVHTYGAGKCFVSVHVEVDADGDITDAHDMIDNIENELSVDGIHLVIHMDPIQYSNPKVMMLKDSVWNAVKDLGEGCEYFSMHDFRVVFGVTHTNILFDLAIPEGFPLDDEALCREIRCRVKKVSPEYNTVLTIDRGYETTRY